MAQEIKGKIEDFKPFIPLIQGLRNPGMRSRHWDQVLLYCLLPYLYVICRGENWFFVYSKDVIRTDLYMYFQSLGMVSLMNLCLSSMQ